MVQVGFGYRLSRDLLGQGEASQTHELGLEPQSQGAWK